MEKVKGKINNRFYEIFRSITFLVLDTKDGYEHFYLKGDQRNSLDSIGSERNIEVTPIYRIFGLPLKFKPISADYPYLPASKLEALSVE